MNQPKRRKIIIEIEEPPEIAKESSVFDLPAKNDQIKIFTENSDLVFVDIKTKPPMAILLHSRLVVYSPSKGPWCALLGNKHPVYNRERRFLLRERYTGLFPDNIARQSAYIFRLNWPGEYEVEGSDEFKFRYKFIVKEKLDNNEIEVNDPDLEMYNDKTYLKLYQ